MKKKTAVICAAALALTLTGCAQDFTIAYGDSQIYSQDDISAALGTLEDFFESDGFYSRCDLHSLEYGGDDYVTTDELDNAAQCCEAKGLPVPDEVIMLESSFRSPIFDTGSMNRYTDYNWNWYLCRCQGGSWYVYSWGEG